MTTEQMTIQDWKKDLLSDGECLDVLLTSIEQIYPLLHNLLIDVDGDVLTDAEAIEIIQEVYCKGQL